jgi:VanZ family protein
LLLKRHHRAVCFHGPVFAKIDGEKINMTGFWKHLLKRRSFWLAMLLLWCLAIYNFSEQPVFNDEYSSNFFSQFGWSEAAADTIDFMARKLAHAVVFSLLAYLALRAMGNWRWQYPAAWVYTTLYALSDEWHQLHVPGRTGSLRDVAIDSAAAFVLIMILYFWGKRSRLNKLP